MLHPTKETVNLVRRHNRKKITANSQVTKDDTMLASGHGIMYGYHGKIAIRLDKNSNMDR